MRLPHKYNRNEGILTFRNDSRIVLGHFQKESDIDAYLGIEYDVILVEEATTLTSRKYRDVSTCCRTSKAGWRPRIYSTTNPGNTGHQWYKARFLEPFRRGEETTTRFVPATVRDNRFVNREYRARLEELTGWQRRAWLDGDWDIAAGQYFTTFRREWQGQPHHVIPYFEPPKAWRFWGALDYGFTHYTTFFLLALSGDGDLFILDEHGERNWLPQRHATAIHALLTRNGLKASHLDRIVAGADCWQKNRGTSDQSPLTIADAYAAVGLPLEQANDDRQQGAAEILRRLGDVEAGIRARLFITERCAHLIDSLPSLEHDPNFPEKVLKVDCDEDGVGGDDWYDAARYGVMDAWGGLYSYLDDVPANDGPGLIFSGSANF
jgi:phage terminase large subunit